MRLCCSRNRPHFLQKQKVSYADAYAEGVEVKILAPVWKKPLTGSSKWLFGKPRATCQGVLRSKMLQGETNVNSIKASGSKVQRFPCWILRQSQFHVPKSLWVFYLLRPLAKSEFSWPCGLSWSNVPPLPFYPWCGEQILEPNPIDTEQNKVKTFQNTVRSLLSKSHRHGAK